MFELVVEFRECLVFLLIYKIFKRGFLHDSKRADRSMSRESKLWQGEAGTELHSGTPGS